MSNLTVFNLKLDRETLKRLTDQTKDSKARIVKDENNLVTLDLVDQRIKIEQSKRGSEMAVFYQRDTPTSNQLQLVGIPACNTFARASKRTAAATSTVDKVKGGNKDSPSTPTKPKKKPSTKNNSNSNNNSNSSPYVRPPSSPVKLDSTIDLPLEERLIHLLALCPHSINTLSKKLNSSALDVSQKIKKVAIPLKDVGTSSTKYILKPKLYSQIRIWDWPLYSSSERREVASNVEEGYSLLRLPPDAPERQNLSQSTNTTSSTSVKKSSLIQPPPGKVNTQTERDRKIAAKKKLNDASPLYNNHTPNSNISQSRAIPPTNTTPTTASTPTSLQQGTGSNNNNNINNNNSNSNSSSTIGTPKLSTSTTTKGKGKIGHASSLSPVAPPPSHHHTTTNNNNHSNSNNMNTSSSNKSQTLKPPTLNTTTSSSTGTTPIAKPSNSPIAQHHASAPPTTSANTPVHRPRGKSPNIFYKPKVSTHDTTVKKRKNGQHNGDGTTRKKQKLSYKRQDIHSQAEFDHLCKEYNHQHTNYLKEMQQFRAENPVYIKLLESVPPQKSNREYAERLKQSYDKDDFAKMLQKTQSFFTAKTYVDGMWDNILEFADLYKINPL